MPLVRRFARAQACALSPKRASWLSCALSIAATLALTACGEVDGDPNYQMPPGLALAADAQVLSDAGPSPAASNGGGSVTPSGGGSVTPSGGGGMTPSGSGSLPLADAQVAFDAAAGDAGGAVSTDPSGRTDAAAPGGGAIEAGPPRMDLGKGNGKDVIAIGDSWMLLFRATGIQESLVKASGQPYRKYGVPGTRLLNGQIPGQYADAKRADPNIKTVVMTGGGNDIIQSAELKADCMQGGAMCEAQLEKIRKALSDLWAQMSKDGVQDVIHVMYSASAGDGVKNGAENNKKIAEACAVVSAPLRCHLLNTDTLITKKDLRDNIHPNDAGYDAIGKAVFALMEQEGMRR